MFIDDEATDRSSTIYSEMCSAIVVIVKLLDQRTKQVTSWLVWTGIFKSCSFHRSMSFWVSHYLDMDPTSHLNTYKQT